MNIQMAYKRWAAIFLGMVMLIPGNFWGGEEKYLTCRNSPQGAPYLTKTMKGHLVKAGHMENPGSLEISDSNNQIRIGKRGETSETD